MLDIKRLQILLKVVETGSVTAAADELFYTPSAVSSSCANLRKRWGNRCFSAAPAAWSPPTPVTSLPAMPAPS